MADQDLKMLDVPRKQQPLEYDTVTAPAHYLQTKLSPMDVIEDWNLDFQLGQVIKYIGRSPYKGQLEDLKKALWYLTRAIEKKENIEWTASSLNKGRSSSSKG